MPDVIVLVMFAGVIAGITHVYLGADHLAALLPLSHGKNRQAFFIGARWGLGHSVGVLLVAVSFLGLRETTDLVVDIDSLSNVGERLVGVVLILLGLFGLRTSARHRLHVHTHQHDGERHTHLHLHDAETHHKLSIDDGLDVSAQHASPALHGHASLIAGIFQGVAGMSFLWGILPALALTLGEASVYLAGFTLGSIAAMTLFAGGVGMLTSRLGEWRPDTIVASQRVASLMCCLVGLFWLVETNL